MALTIGVNEGIHLLSALVTSPERSAQVGETMALLRRMAHEHQRPAA